MRKFGRWKSFDFGPETNAEINVNERQSPPQKQNSSNQDVTDAIKENRTSNSFKKLNFDFNKEVAPKIVTDLAVHCKKIQEVEGWLKLIEGSLKNQKTKFLLITGPTGCGKATTIHVLCKSMNVEITEWVNPVDIDYEVFKGPGQVIKFLNFFSEGKYNSLFNTGNKKKIFLIKDIPNVFVKNPEEFFHVLEDVYFKATHPVVFICTDSSSNAINLQRSLFPEEIRLKYAIAHISFNACAPTLLKKSLKRTQEIMQGYPDLFCKSTQSTIDTILLSSMGDIRSSMNQLYLACLIDDKPLVMNSKTEKLGSKRKRTDQSITIKHMVRDETLGLFHGLGRVLNPKRKVEGNTWRLNCDIGKLVDEFSIQPAMFITFLFENYLKYFGDLEDVEKSIDYLSLSTVLMENWDNHDNLVLALWISVLGLMVFNEHRESRWNQIKGPRKLEKVCASEDKERLHPTDRFYYNMITKTEKYHKFNCNF